MKKILLFFFACSLLVPAIGFGQYLSIGPIAIQYSNPGINNDLEVVADLFFTSSGSGRVGYSSTIANDTLYLTSCYFSGPAATPSQMKDILQVGSIPTGIRGLHFRAYYSWNQNVCDSTTFINKSVAFVVQSPTGISAKLPDTFYSLHPNPATDHFQITGSPVSQLHLYDLRGKLVKRYDFGAQNPPQISIADLPKGIYMAEMISRNGEVSRKRLVKQ